MVQTNHLQSQASQSKTAISRRHILSVLDINSDEFLSICKRALELKRSLRAPQTLGGKSVGIYFRKPSTRTRAAFTSAAGRLGAAVVNLNANELQLSTGETIADTARVLSAYLDVLVIRTNESVEEMWQFASHLSVINALSDDEHPTQALADITTLLEHFQNMTNLSILYCGEGNKTAASLALAVSRMQGMKLTIACPDGYGLNADILATAKRLAGMAGGRIDQVHNLKDVSKPFDVVYTSRWQEMGVEKPESNWKRRFQPFKVTRDLIAKVSNNEGAVFLHDLPAVRGEDVENEVLDSEYSLAWIQAENKMYSAMAAIEWCSSSICGLPK